MTTLPTQEELGVINLDHRAIVDTMGSILETMALHVCWFIVLTCDLVSLVPRYIINQNSVKIPVKKRNKKRNKNIRNNGKLPSLDKPLRSQVDDGLDADGNGDSLKYPKTTDQTLDVELDDIQDNINRFYNQKTPV